MHKLVFSRSKKIIDFKIQNLCFSYRKYAVVYMLDTQRLVAALIVVATVTLRAPDIFHVGAVWTSLPDRLA